MATTKNRCSRETAERQGELEERESEMRFYFKTILTDNVTLLQSAKRSCHAPA